MKPDTSSAAADLLREIVNENPNATEEELLNLFLKATANDEDAAKACFSFYRKNHLGN
jgi:hypothetical protein